MKHSADHTSLAPLIHVGYMKAGSTSFQSVFGNPECGFACDQEVHMRPPDQVKNDRIVDYLVLTHDLEFDPEYLRSIAHEEIGWARPAGRVPLISSEQISGQWLTGGHNSKVLADRIKAAWPDARILIIFREQKAMINSVYRFYVRKGGTRSFQRLLNPEGSGHKRGPGFSLRAFKYDQLVNYYQQCFGRASVLALPLEMLNQDTAGVFRRILEFSGVKKELDFPIARPWKKAGIDAYTASYKRLLNPIVMKDYINDYCAWCTTPTQVMGEMLLKIANTFATNRQRKSAAEALEKQIQDAVRGYYGRSNSNLEELIGIELGGYGYDLTNDDDQPIVKPYSRPTATNSDLE